MSPVVYDQYYEKRSDPTSPFDNHLQAMVNATSKEQLWDCAESLAETLSNEPAFTAAELIRIMTAVPTDENGQAIFGSVTDDDPGNAADVAIEIWIDPLLERAAREEDIAEGFAALLGQIVNSENPSWIRARAVFITQALYSHEPELPTQSVQCIAGQLLKDAGGLRFQDDSYSISAFERRTDLSKHIPFFRLLGLSVLCEQVEDLMPDAGAAAGTWSSRRSAELFSDPTLQLIAAKTMLNALEWKTIKETGIPTYTKPFREPNLFVLGEQVAPILALERDGPVRITEIGCSNGSETWSLAAILAEQGIDYTIQACDTNPGALYIAENCMMRLSIEDKEQLEAISKQAYLAHFRCQGCFASPHETLRRNVTFTKLDIADQPLQPNSADVVIINNVFPYFTPKARNQIVSNMLAGLRPGGVFIFEGITDTFKGHVDYPRWARGLVRFGLRPFSADQPVAEDNVPHILRYR
jgi:chemotaxis methyl-accepting protein methylase